MIERYLYDNVYVRRRFDHVCQLLEQSPVRVLQPATEEAIRETGAVLADLQVELGRFEVGKTVAIEVEGFARDEGGEMARLHLRWSAAGHQTLFPAMDADLVVYDLGSDRTPLTQVSFVGHYRPPLGPVGVAGDALVGRRVAQASIRHFLIEVGRRLERELSPRGNGRYLDTPAN